MAKQKGGGINVKVLTMTNELEFTIRDQTLGKELFENVLQTTGIRERWYFGLQFTDINDNKCWLDQDKKVSEQRIKRGSRGETIQFLFRIKFYPETAEDEVIQNSTLSLFYYQTKKDVLNENIYCPAEKAVLLASFAAQVKHGNLENVSNKDVYLSSDEILPESVVSGHKLSREDWEGKVSMFHAKHKAMTREEAMMEYMKVSQDLETYGVQYFDVVNKKKTEVLLGVDALGINIYEKSNKLSPNISYPWSEISKIKTSSDNKIILMFTDRKAPKMTVTCVQPKMKHQIYHLVNGNHEMYKRRRRPDTMEIQQMKSERDTENERRNKEKALLLREMEAREKAEQQRIQMEEKYREMEEKIKKKQEEVEEKDAKIKELEEQLRALREAKDNLEQQQTELREMMAKLEEDKTMADAEREKIVEEVRMKQEEIDKIKSEVDEKERIARELQEEVEQSRLKMEESMAAMANGDTHSDTSASDQADNNEEIPTIIVDPVDDGREVNMNEEMTEDVEDLSKELEAMKDEENETEEHRLYRENVRLTGRDKYKTLRQVRQGNTKRRIDSFENL